MTNLPLACLGVLGLEALLQLGDLVGSSLVLRRLGLLSLFLLGVAVPSRGSGLEGSEGRGGGGVGLRAYDLAGGSGRNAESGSGKGGDSLTEHLDGWGIYAGGLEEKKEIQRCN